MADDHKLTLTFFFGTVNLVSLQILLYEFFNQSDHFKIATNGESGKVFL